MTDKYNVVIEVVDTKEYISIELPQDEDSLQEQLKEYGINENTKVRLPFLNGKIENDEDMLIETDLWYVTDKTFSGMEGLNVLLSKSEELKNERVESYAMEHRDEINSPENLLNLLVQKEDIPYHEYTSDPDAGITRGTSANGKFGRTYLYENYKEMWHIFILTLLIIAISLIFLCVRLFFGRKFVHTHVDGNKAMHARGIHCAQSLDAEERRENRFKVNEKNS